MQSEIEYEKTLMENAERNGTKAPRSAIVSCISELILHLKDFREDLPNSKNLASIIFAKTNALLESIFKDDTDGHLELIRKNKEDVTQEEIIKYITKAQVDGNLRINLNNPTKKKHPKKRRKK